MPDLRQPIALGPFDLLAPAGHGGMGLVWRGVHRVRRLPVAIKCLRPERGLELWRAMFLREVQAIARLEHPNIVPLHAFGALPRPIPAPDGGTLPAGTPYLVMDWINGGALSARAVADWPTIRRVLVALLDGLAHAHARGVVHRDVKPANVLLDGERAILTDFGLAHHDPSGGPAGDGISGTPGYMAPEQVAGQGWRIGPWTDLYAVGCLGWALACGRPPHAQSDPRLHLRALLEQPLPAFAPRVSAPLAFPGWLRRMLARAPEQRFPSAAHARAALPPSDAELAAPAPDPLGDAASGWRSDAPASSTLADGPTRPDGPPSIADTGIASTAPLPTDATAELLAAVSPPSDAAALLAAPLPADWRGEPHTPALYLDLAGETVADLRDPPLQGRNAERDRLWAALRRVAEGEGTRAVVLTGAAGVGKSRLARWLAERAHQHLGARLLWARHGPMPQPGTGPRAMVARALNIADGVDRPARVSRALPDAPGLAAAVLALFEPDGAATVDGIRVHLRDEGERLGAMARLLEHWARRRLLVVHIEDGQWADEALRLMRLVLERMAEAPILWLVTRRADRPTRAATGALPALHADPRVESLPVSPLGRDALTAALRRWLPLSISAVDRIVQRAGGSPQYAVELIRARLRSGALVAAPGGLRLRADSLPAGLAQVWQVRLDVELGHASGPVVAAWQLAALIGLDVHEASWAAVTAHLDRAEGPSTAEQALERLLAARLAYVDAPGQWRFAHPAVREALLAHGTIDVADGHRRCAEALLARLDAEPDGALRLRVGEHLMGAGQPAAALDHLLAAGRLAVESRDYAWLPRVVLTGARALRASGRRLDGPAGIELRLLWSHPHPDADPKRARRHARRAARDAVALGDAGLEARATALLSNLWIAASAADALPHGERAVELTTGAGEPLLEFEARMRLSYLLRSLGRLDDAAAQVEAAAALPVPDTPGIRVRLATQRAVIAQYRGDTERARVLSEDALDDAHAAGDVQARIQIHVTLGEVARGAGDLEAAERHYREAARSGRLSGHAAGDFNAINLGLVLVARRRFVDARRHLEATRVHLERAGVPIGIWLVNLALLPCDAAAGDWDRWDGRWPHLAAFVDGRFVDPDIADIARTAATEAEAAGQGMRADEAWRLAGIQLDALGRAAERAQLDEAWTAARACRVAVAQG